MQRRTSAAWFAGLLSTDTGPRSQGQALFTRFLASVSLQASSTLPLSSHILKFRPVLPPLSSIAIPICAAESTLVGVSFGGVDTGPQFLFLHHFQPRHVCCFSSGTLNSKDPYLLRGS